MKLSKQILQSASESINSVFGLNIPADQLLLNETKKEFEGDFTIVVFPLVKQLKQAPEKIGTALGEHMVEHSELISSFNVIKGFLNLSLSDSAWKSELEYLLNSDDKYRFEKKDLKALVEFSSPNTNKPLHLGHLRNIFLGWSMAQILEAFGYEVVKTQIVNDRGIAVCKSMYAWQKFGNMETPESSGIKGDMFVGKYYVLFNQKLEEEYTQWLNSDEAQSLCEDSDSDSIQDFALKYKNEYFNKHSKIGADTRQLLLDWESGDKETRELWAKMNSWVYQGFDKTYKDLGVDFDILYYESDTYLLGKEVVMKGLESKVFYKEEDGSVWIDLEEEKLDKKIVLRSDGTSVYVTQDIGTARQRYEDHKMDHMVYVVGDEQEYHFKVLFATLKKLGVHYADNLYHLSYGMVELPSGKMKSREGTVVDADDLVSVVIEEARDSTVERGELTDLSEEERNEIYANIGLGALKYFILRINPRKWMTFDPKESLDLQGQTAPYIQNAYVRIQSVLRKSDEHSSYDYAEYEGLNAIEKEILRHISMYKSHLKEAAESNDPSQMANYAYNLAKMYHRFYHDYSILRAESEPAKVFRLQLSKLVAVTLEESMRLLGIDMPSHM